MSYYDEPPAENTDNRACSGLREELKMCIRETECVQTLRKTPRECFDMHHPSIPQECYALKNGFFECKRSLLDARQRFRGRKGY